MFKRLGLLAVVSLFIAGTTLGQATTPVHPKQPNTPVHPKGPATPVHPKGPATPVHPK